MISTVINGRPSSVNVNRVEYRIRSLSLAEVSSACATPIGATLPAKAITNVRAAKIEVRHMPRVCTPRSGVQVLGSEAPVTTRAERGGAGRSPGSAR